MIFSHIIGCDHVQVIRETAVWLTPELNDSELDYLTETDPGSGGFMSCLITKSREDLC